MSTRTSKRAGNNRWLRADRSWRELGGSIIRLRFVATLVVLLFFSTSLSHIWAFEYAGIRSQEVLQRAIPSVPASYARVVRITDDDYRTVFGELLEPKALDRVLDRVLEYQPAVVVVDLDTSARRFRELKPRPAFVVWARDVAEAGASEGIALLPVRGDMDSSGVSWGLALFPRSLDWSVRSYRHTYQVGSTMQPSLHWEAVRRFCETPASQEAAPCSAIRTERGNEENDRSVPILHARYKFEAWPLGDLVSGTADAASKNSDLAGKVVVLGGSYSAQDRHQTPFSLMDGVELVASAIEAELNPQRGVEMGDYTAILFKVLLALLIAAVHVMFRPMPALFTTAGLLTLLVLFGSLIAAVFAGYRANVIPFVMGILIEQLYTSAERAEHALDVRSEPLP